MTAFAHTPAPRRRASGLPIALAVGIAALVLVRGLATGTPALPEALSDAEFWQLSTKFSESGGVFPSKNYVSNEVPYQTVIPTLRAKVASGGVYLGVGPDQNFTYITALRPGIAFIVDIRPENRLHHLLYKALIELSPDRATFLERLFSRPRALDDPVFDTLDEILAAARARAPSEAAYRRNFRDILAKLRLAHALPITPDDEQTLNDIYSAFFRHGPDITYAPLPVVSESWFGPQPTPFPSYADLVTQTDQDGTNWSYLASADNYQWLRGMHSRNLIVPVVGDFAGPHALRAVGDWVRAHGATITTLYTSNVEQYLFQNQVWRDYYANVSTLPLDETSTFIRSYFPSGAFIRGPARIIGPDGRPFTLPSPSLRGGSPFVESYILLDPVPGLLDAVAGFEIETYLDVINRSR